MKESESLLLVPSGSHSTLSQYHTKLNLELKLAKILCSENYNFWFESACLQSQYIVKNIQSRRQEKRGRKTVKLSLQWVSVIDAQKIEQRIALV